MTLGFAANANFAGSGTGDIKSPIKRWVTLLFVFLFVSAASSLATASAPIFAISKNFCSGVPSPSAMSSPQSCSLATSVAQGDPVYYVISITSPWGQPQQVVDLADQYPVGFVPTAGGLFCKDNLGNPVPHNASSVPNGIAQVTLNMAQTIHCFVPGTFQNVSSTPGDDTGSKPNTVKGKNKDGYVAQDTVPTDVLQTNPLGSDLGITKTSSGPIDISSGGDSITYTITITNYGPADVDIGDWFTLHDNLSLPPSSVPLMVDYAGASCVVNTTSANANNTPTDCLDPNGPNLVNGSPLLVGSMSPKPFFNWTFAPGTGHINAGDSITLTITIKVNQLSGIDCVAALNADGLRNTAFFTLIDPKTGSAFADSNPANNTAVVTTPVTTGQTLEDPDCGTGHLRITKKQISPTPVTAQVGWGAPVTYEITIKNVSLPNQPITIAKKDLEDWVTQGINTPRFYRSHIATKCVASSIPGICAPFTPAINVGANPFQYLYYGHTDKAWETGAAIKLPTNGDYAKFHTTFAYEKPDCETVPNANPKPIYNTAKVKYFATVYGASPKSPQNVTYNQESTAQTNMENQPPCKFVVTKVMAPNSPTKVQFGVQMEYIVRFTNFGNPRTIGTIMDVGRINIPDYATSLPFSSNWNCTKSAGVTGNGPLIGSSTGSLNYTATPAMGAPVILNLGNNIFFPTNGTITCNVKVVIKRPPFNDPYCTTKPAYFENMAMMDTTHPFNTNIFWPPSGSYVSGQLTNPTPQDRNWAMASNMLPKCWDAHVEKKASVGGLPANTPAWTYAGNTNAVNYSITTTNDADSLLGTAIAPPSGWTVTDTLTHTPSTPVPFPPYSNANNLQGTPVCSPSGWCWTAPIPNDGKKQIGIKSLAPNASGVWNIKTTGPWTNGISIRNCAKVQAVGVNAGPDWYDNRANDPSRLESCVDVPVIETTKIEVRKQVIDQTGAGITAIGSFGFSVACSPYAIPTSAASTFNLSTGSSGYSSYHAVTPVAKYGSCTVTETSMPAIPAAMATKCGGAGNVLVASNSPVTLTSLASVNNQVTVTNTYKCNSGMGQLEVIKSFTTLQTPVQWPATSWTINTNCTPTGSASSVTITTPASGNAVITGSALVTAPIGAQCTVDEPQPTTSFPTWITNYCAMPSHGGGLPIWDTPTYTVNGVTTTTPPTVGIGNTVQTVKVNNAWHCGASNTGTLTVIKAVTTPQGPFPFPSKSWLIGTNCTPTGSASSITLTTAQTGNATVSASGSVTAPIGANCTVSETQPTTAMLPSWAAGYCATSPGGPQWAAPTYTVNGVTTTTAPIIGITAGTQSVIVNNSWSCAPSGNGGGGGSTDDLEIIKTVVGPAIPVQFPATTFDIGVVCNPAASASLLSITTPASSNASITASGLFVAPANANCVVSETQPAIPVAAINHCKTTNGTSFTAIWEAPAYAPSSSVNMGAGVQTVTVTNKWKCVINHPWMLSVIKTVQGPTGAPILAVMPFVISANCPGSPSPSSLTINTATTSAASSMFLSPGAQCTLSEVQPTLPVAADTYCATATPGGTAKWNAPTYSLPMPIAGDFPSNNKTVTVTNSWFCLSPAKVAPKKKKKSKFKINIGIGIGGGGGGRDKPRDTPPPQPR